MPDYVCSSNEKAFALGVKSRVSRVCPWWLISTVYLASHGTIWTEDMHALKELSQRAWKWSSGGHGSVIGEASSINLRLERDHHNSKNLPRTIQTPRHPPKPFKLTSSLELLEPFRTVQNLKKIVPYLKSFQIRREAWKYLQNISQLSEPKRLHSNLPKLS